MARYQENKVKNCKTNSIVKFNNLIFPSEKSNCCDSNMCMIGPFWTDNIFDEDWVKALKKNLQRNEFCYLKYNSRLQNICKGILNELPLNSQIFNLDYSQFLRDVNLSSFKFSLFQCALVSLGYKVGQSYYDPNLFKIDTSNNSFS